MMLLEIEVDPSDVLSVESFIGGPLPGNWASDHEHLRPLGMGWLASQTSVVLRFVSDHSDRTQLSHQSLASCIRKGETLLRYTLLL